jgi:predicted lactoylglutathione lyase
MPMLFINLPVADLTGSREFYTAVGFRVHEQYSTADTLAVVVSDEVALMLRPDGSGAPGSAQDGVVHCLTVDDRADADRRVEAGLAAGGTPGTPAGEDDLRYVRGVRDPDGHAWEFMVMGQLHVVN